MNYIKEPQCGLDLVRLQVADHVPSHERVDIGQ